jgi:dihydrofolate reductase
MGKIVVSENVTLDGVIQDPAGDEGFRVGGWAGLIRDSPQLTKLALDEALGAEALLLGRRSYDWFAARWPSRSGELADRLNSLPKYVVSSTLRHPAWNNSTVLEGWRGCRRPAARSAVGRPAGSRGRGQPNSASNHIGLRCVRYAK